MEAAPVRAEGTAFWLLKLLTGGLALVGLFAWQAWLTLGLFGAYPWPDLLSDEPLMSGGHPQWLYMGTQGAHGLVRNGNMCVYMPASQGGVPKTPIFDGSRIAALALYLAGGAYSPAAYKISVVIVSMLVPVLMFLAAWGMGLRWPGTILAVFLGMLIWWGPHGRFALEAGDTEIFVASLAMLAHVGLLVRFDNRPGFRCWLGLLVTAALGWFCQPLLFPIALPLLLVFYLSAGVRHESWLWHGALFIAEFAALGLNFSWLSDWVSYWWLRSPLPQASTLLSRKTIGAFWNAPLWGGCGLRFLAVVLLASGLIGVFALHGLRQRPAARLFGLGALGLLTMAFLGISWEPLGEVGTAALFVPGLWFAVLPATFAWTGFVRGMGHYHLGRGILLVLVCLLSVGIALEREELATLAERMTTTSPLPIGLGEKRQELVRVLREETTSAARILWEDRVQPRTASRWPTLLPMLTDRAFVGGLDPGGIIEHSSISFVQHKLEGRPIEAWTPRQLDEYCRRYNIGWIVAWTPDVIARLRAWDGVVKERPVEDDIPGVLFTLKPRDFTFCLKGKAEVTHADWHHITLRNVEPDQGVVVLNFHYQAGMVAWPHRVGIERETSGQDPIGFIRLKLNAPAPVVTLTWQPR
jgi:hypothetical protein